MAGFSQLVTAAKIHDLKMVDKIWDLKNNGFHRITFFSSKVLWAVHTYAARCCAALVKRPMCLY